MFTEHTKRNRQDIDIDIDMDMDMDMDMDNSIAVNKQMKADLKVVIKCVKDDLFAKVKFICEQNVDLVHVPVWCNHRLQH
jgi:hypothetical protein